MTENHGPSAARDAPDAGAVPRVLIVDQGASFGGSALVASAVVNHMPAGRYDVRLAAAIPPESLRGTAAAAGKIRRLAKPYDYVDQARARERRLAWPATLRRASGWVDLGVRLARNAGYTAQVSGWIRENGIRLVHLNNGFENLEAHLAATLTGRPFVIHAHGPCGTSRLTRTLARRAPRCIAISHPVGQSLIEAGVPPERVTVLPNPLTLDPTPIDDRTRTEVRSRHGIPPAVRTIGIVGRIVEWKGQLEFLRAAARVMAQDPGIGAVIVGDVTDASDAYGRAVRNEVEHLGLTGRVWFTGFLADPREVYALVDVLVHSSISPEPFGLVLTEAMALGIPVVAADAGGPLEILTEDVTGYLRNPLDPAAVAERVSALLRDSALRQRISAAGRQAALARFDPVAYAERLAGLYDAALGERAGGTP